MSDEIVGQAPAVFSSKERAALVARALSEAARRARFSTKKRRALTGGGVRARRGARLLRLLKIGTFVGIVTVAEAERWVTNVEEFRMRLRGITSGTAAAINLGAMASQLQRFGN